MASTTAPPPPEEAEAEAAEAEIPAPASAPPRDHVHAVREVVEEEQREGAERKRLQPSAYVEGKTIVLVRHGQSFYNEHYATTGSDPMIFDADLTPLGVEQAKALRPRLAGLGIELAVTSPLRRAVRTCLLSLPPPTVAAPTAVANGSNGEGGKAINYEVWTEPQELLEASCDMGDRLPAEMSAEFGPALDFGHLPPVWWYVPEACDPQDPQQCRCVFRERGFVEPYDVFKRRVDALATRLKARPERVIAVFGHGDFFHVFLRLHMGVRGKWMDNCEVVTGKLLA